MINKGKHLYKIIPFWMKKERTKPDPAPEKEIKDVVEEKPWINQDVKWSFSLSLPRWMWILIYLVILYMLWI
jgi:hypothetical protein